MGYASTLEYVKAAAAAVLHQTGLLPHINAGRLCLLCDPELVTLCSCWHPVFREACPYPGHIPLLPCSSSSWLQVLVYLWPLLGCLVLQLSC